MSLAVRETLAARLLDGNGRTIRIVEAKLDPVIVAEVVFRQIPVQVLLAAMLVDAAHTALEDAEKAFR